ncbi:MAG: RNA polymerase sigma factor region1.1 domain-containing protein, partial [Patescibacteria group bacterium]|nr:RNA polymerase sigma factor region1.1 domain-containing protein [Patescibacteria group bacterium]
MAKRMKKKKKSVKKAAKFARRAKPVKRTHTKKKKVAKRLTKKTKRTKKQVVRAAVRGAKAKANSAKALSAETLIEKGKERGYVTYNEILKSFPHVEDDVSFLESLYERFAIAGVDVLEGGMLEDAADE